MKKDIFLAMLSIFVIFMAISAHGQQGFDQAYTDSPSAMVPYISEGQYYVDGSLNQYSEFDGFELTETGSSSKESTIYQTAAPSGAPVPVAPSSPDILGLDIPPESSIVDYKEAPRSAEAEDSLIAATDFAPTDFAKAGIDRADTSATGFSSGQQRRATSSEKSTYPASISAAVPGGVIARNELYLSYVPQTTGACRLFGWQPMWLQISSSGPLWIYEWYPNGELSVKYLGYSSAGWNKKWFNGDVPGWHILQYYCNGWSNYIYVYVYGQGSGTWTDRNSYVPVPLSGTAAVTLRSSWLLGYDVYLDGEYIGTEGFGKDLSDGIYRFNVPGNMWHTIVISKDGESYWETGTFLSGAAYRFTI